MYIDAPRAPAAKTKDVRAAKRYLTELLLHQSVEIEMEFPYFADRYDRLQAHVFLLDAQGERIHVNLELLRMGIASYNPSAAYGKSKRYDEEFRSVENKVKKMKLGRWAQ